MGFWTHTHTGRRIGKDKGREWNNAIPSKEHPQLPEATRGKGRTFL